MTRDKKYTISQNHGEYATGIYETRTQALQVWWDEVQSQFSPEEIQEVLESEGLDGSATLEYLYGVFEIDTSIMEVYI